MKITLRQDFMPSAVLVMAGPVELFPQVVRRPLPFRGPHIRRTASRPPRTGRLSNGNSNLENTLVVEVDDQSIVGREEGNGTADQPHGSHIKSETCVQRAHCTSDHVRCRQYA